MNFYHGDRYVIRFNEADGKYWKYLEKNYRKVVFNGSEDWEKMSNNIYRVKVENLYYSKPLSNYFLGTTRNELKNGETATKTWNFRNAEFRYDDITTLEEWKTWLSTHNTEVIYKLKVPELIPLEPLDIMNMTYYPLTNAFTSIDNIFLKAKYYRDFVNTIRNMQIDNNTLKNQLQDIEKRLSAVESKPTVEPQPEPTVEEVSNNA